MRGRGVRALTIVLLLLTAVVAAPEEHRLPAINAVIYAMSH